MYSEKCTNTMDPLLHLPDDLMLLILSYVDSKDCRHVSHCSHAYRIYITEKGLLHFYFDEEHSLMYYQGLIGRNIRVTRSRSRGVNLYDEVERRGGKVMRLNLSDNAQLRDVSHFRGVRELILSKCTGITSGFDQLGGVHTLDLSYCSQLEDEDIINLGTVSKLDLSWCDNITNVSHLRGVRELKLIGCTGIRVK